MDDNATPLSKLLLQCTLNSTTNLSNSSDINKYINPNLDVCRPLRDRLLCSYHTIISTTVLAMSKVVTKLTPTHLMRSR